MRHTLSHPSVCLPPELTRLIRSLSGPSEKLRQLHPDLLKIIYGEKWFRLFVPEEYGGLALSLPEAVRLEEALSWADGSLGWVVTLCAGAGWFTGFLSGDIGATIFSEETACIAGSGAPSGNAVISDGGYLINGVWKYASGCLHATAFTANCMTVKEGETLLMKDGSPLIRSFLFEKEEVIVHANWDGMGMVATASHSFEVKDRMVPEERCFTIDPEHVVLDNPVYKYPFLSLAEVTLAVNISGLANHFMDLCETLFPEKINAGLIPPAHAGILYEELNKAKDILNEYRRVFYNALEESWRSCVSGESISSQIPDSVSKASRDLARQARRLVDRLYPYCGLSAAQSSSEINRVWRDINTAGQHALLVF